VCFASEYMCNFVEFRPASYYVGLLIAECAAIVGCDALVGEWY